MKPLRLLLIGLSLLVVLVLVAVALAFNSGVQTWAARKFAPASPELTVTLGRVDAALNQTRLENVRVVQPGLVLTLPSADVDVAVIDAAGGKIEVKRLVAKGWILDLTAPVPPGSRKPDASKSPEDSAKEAFDGVFKLLELPFELRVDGVDLAGEVILPEGRAQVSLVGGGIAPGSDGKFALVTTFKATDASTLDVRGTLTAVMDTPRTFERIQFTTEATGKGPQLPKGATLTLDVNATRNAAGEAYVVAMRSAAREVFRADITVPGGNTPLSGAWKIDATHVDVAPFALGQPMPEFEAKGQGKFNSDRLFTRINASGSLHANVTKLEKIQAEFAALGRLSLSAGFGVATVGDIVRVELLDVRVAGAKPVASVVALQAVEFNTATGELKAADPVAELLRVTLDGIPLAWAKPFLGDLALTGEDVRGTFIASARDGGFALRPSAPITINALSVKQAGEPLIEALDVSLSAQADYTPKGWTADVTGLSAGSGGANILKLTAKAAQPAGSNQPLTASGDFEVNLPALLAQPVAAGSAALKQGVARGNFSATSAKEQQVNLTLQLAGLIAADSTPLPEVAVQARADIDASGRITAKAPILITQGKRRSDLNLQAVITSSAKNTDIQARLNSDVVHVADLTALSAVSPTPPEGDDSTEPVEKPAPKPDKKAPPPTEPLWAGLTGELKLDFKRLIYSKGVETTLVGAIKITPDALTLEGLKGVFKTGGDLKADGGLTFDKGHKRPYVLKADVVLTDVEPAPILRALSPKEPSPVEGKFDFKTTLGGRAVDPALFGENVIGDIHLSSKGGTFKALDMKSGAIVEGAGAVAGIAGAIGVLAGHDSTVKYAERARAAVDVTKQLGSIKFDQLNMLIVRDKKKNLDIKDLTLISPIVHLTGAGQIKHAKGKSIVERPLALTMKLGAKDKLAADLRTLKLIEKGKDPLGYASLAEDIKLDGSLESVGTSQLKGLLDRALSD